MKSGLVDSNARSKTSTETSATIGLFLNNSADRRLLIDFLQESGYRVRAGVPSQIVLADWTEISLIIAGERAAQDFGKELLRLKHQSGGFFLPVLIALSQHSESAPWIRAGFDDVLRVPVRKAELLARLQVYLYLRDQSEELRGLARQVVLAQEAERQRLSRELHDEIGQALTAVNFNLQAFQHSVAGSANTAQLQDSLNIIESTMHQVRDLSLDLHPAILDDLGLVAALQWYVDRQGERAGLTIQLFAKPAEMNISAELKTTCFRIAQEALTNILRHAQAKVVRVELRQRQAELELVIRDDGIGFDVQSARRRAARGASLGLHGMQERASLLKGQINIKSTPGSGTEIRARFPLSAVDLRKPHGARRKSK